MEQNIIFKVVVIEDEEPARNLIRNFLKDCENIELVEECSDGFCGVKAINEHKPDIVILDIQMPKLTGFEVLELIEHKPVVIFSTAYDQYAIKAFDENAIDYILKPYSKARFIQAINKAIIAIEAQTGENAAAIDTISKISENKPEPLQRIAVKSGAKVFVLPINQIQFIEADGDYVKVHTRDSAFLKEKTMRYFETNLPKDEFVRVHRSNIININEISKIEPFDKDSHIVILKSGVNIKTSSNGYKALKQSLGL